MSMLVVVILVDLISVGAVSQPQLDGGADRKAQIKLCKAHRMINGWHV